MGESEAGATVRFLPDVASEEDFFGSHQRLADAILETIRQPDVKMIGLIGRWGSGKSTVVKLVGKALKTAKTHDLRMFSFDAWLHQSDPPRRAFLDQFIAFLEAEKLGEPGTWDKELDELHRRIEKTKSKATPILTTAGRWFLITFFLLPLGFAFASKSWYEVWRDDTGVIHWLFPIGLFLIALPGIVAVWLYLAWRPTWRFWEGDGWRFWTGPFWSGANWSRHKAPHEKQSILSLISNRNITRQTSKVFKTPEPTAIEFQAMFRKILSSLVEPAPRLIIVIDNLDRLARDDAAKMWTTIRSFFLGAIQNVAEGPPVVLPTVLLPIDESAALRASHVESGNSDDLAKSFLDKTFDVTFHVTQPVLSDWKAYLEKQLEATFGAELQAQWVFDTARIYRFKADSGVPVTPRDINKSVAAIAALWLQWKSSIPYVSIAYYAIYRDRFETFANGINNPVADISEQDPDWQQSVAALHYGVPPEQAVQVLIDGPLRAAVARNSRLQFAALINRSGFGAAVERLVDDPAFMEPTNVIHLAELLDGAALEQGTWTEFAWSTLRTHYKRSNLWTHYKEESVDTARRLIDHCPKNRQTAFLKGLTDRMSEWPPALYQEEGFVHAATEIIRLVAARADQAKIQLAGITIRSSPEAFLEIASSLVDEQAATMLINSRRTDADREKLVIAFSQQLREGYENGNLEAKARAALATKIKSWDDQVTMAVGVIQSAPPADERTSTAALVLGSLIARTEKTAIDAVRSTAQSGNFQAMLNAANSKGDAETMARAIALQILGKQAVASPAGSWDNLITSMPELPGLVDAVIQQWRVPTFMRSYIAQLESDPAIMPLIKPMVGRRVEEKAMGNLHIEGIISDPEKYMVAMTPEQSSSFIDQLSGYVRFWDRAQEAGIADGSLKILGHLISSSGVSADVRKRARQVLSASLKAVPTDEWVNSIIEKDDEPFATAENLQSSSGRPAALGLSLYDALSRTMPELIASVDRPYARPWFRAAQLLGAPHRRTLFRTMRDHLLSLTTPPIALERLLEAGGSPLLDDGDFLAKADEVVRSIVQPLLQPASIQWLLDQADRIKDWLVAAKNDTREHIMERARAVLDELDGEDKTRLDLILQNWKS